MNNAELAETLVANHNLSKADARKVVDDLMAAIVAAAAKGEEVSLSGFGKFKDQGQPGARRAQSFQRRDHSDRSLEEADVRPAKAVKDALNG